MGFLDYEGLQYFYSKLLTRFKKIKAQISEITQNTAENVLLYPYINTSTIINELTFTVNDDGTVTVNGTATEDTLFVLRQRLEDTGFFESLKDKRTYTLSGCPSDGDTTTYSIYAQIFKNSVEVDRFNDYGDGSTFTLDKTTCDDIEICILIKSGITVQNLTFKPMLELGNVVHDYVPHNLSSISLRRDIKSIIEDGAGIPDNILVASDNGEPDTAPIFDVDYFDGHDSSYYAKQSDMDVVLAEIDDKITITKNILLTEDWKDTGISGTDLSDGSYVVQISGLSTDAIGTWYETWTGFMTWYSQNTNCTGADEIILHKAGHSCNNGTITLYLRTLRHITDDNTTGILTLQIAATKDASVATDIIFKFRKLI